MHEKPKKVISGKLETCIRFLCTTVTHNTCLCANKLQNKSTRKEDLRDYLRNQCVSEGQISPLHVEEAVFESKKDILTSFKRPKWPIRPNRRLRPNAIR